MAPELGIVGKDESHTNILQTIAQLHNLLPTIGLWYRRVDTVGTRLDTRL
jgi:hypothetical protein